MQYFEYKTRNHANGKIFKGIITADNMETAESTLKKRGEDITFLRRIVRGPADGSYGIEVAKLAGLPNEVIKRAREVLAHVEESSKAVRDAVDASGTGSKKPVADDGAITMDDMLDQQLIEELRQVDLNTLSPFECMSLMFEWKKRYR